MWHSKHSKHSSLAPFVELLTQLCREIPSLTVKTFPNFPLEILKKVEFPNKNDVQFVIIISILSYHFTFLFRFPQFHLNSVFGMIHLDSYFAFPIFVIFGRRATADTAIVFQIGPFSYSTLFCSMSIENKAEAVSFFIAHFLGQKREKRILQLADIFCFEPEKF